ncbi:hypothetical protein BDV39DRAFT_201100 [Aspergillus sergii]|uniref:NAD(P)-binding protein n=1 Tax=Aspergillus sergii TaxID=1034303 RepID=A0A5N6XH56_9EURO|nr:hypothetical protein BDV39DRAFT_201100 [Aspergillus sergii]
MDFPGVALITGAGSGIGQQTSILYAKEGCQRLTIADINSTALEHTQQLINSVAPAAQVLVRACDVSKEEEVEAMVDETVTRFGRIDYCANVAGISLLGPPTDQIATALFDRDQNINLRGLFFCERAELRAMLKQEPDSRYTARGSIVNVSSMAGLVGLGDLPVYSASKHGVVGLSKADGMHYGQHGIRVNTVCPGAINTPILQNSGNAVGVKPLTSPDAIQNALGRFGDPQEVAEALVWITSHRASYITAAVLAVNGGQIGA